MDLESPDHLVTMGYIFVAGDTRGIARASTVLDASMEEASAWEMAKMSRENMKEHAAYGGLERSLLAQNQHKNTYQVGLTNFSQFMTASNTLTSRCERIM